MTTHITSEKMAALKQQLLHEQARLHKERAAYRNDDIDDSEEDAAGELSHSDPNDPADEASNLFDRERNQAAIENADRILAKIARALEKMEEGT